MTIIEYAAYDHNLEYGQPEILRSYVTPHLTSLARYAPSTKLALIGDSAVVNAVPGCISVEPYSERLKQLTASFVNYSPNPDYFELSCLQRWFVIYEYAKKNNICEFWTFDWDVLVFADLYAEAQSMANVSITLPLGTFFCRDIELLNPWLEWILDLYSHPENIPDLMLKMAKRGMFHISDMQLAFWYYACSGRSMFNLLENITESGVWDSNLSLAEHGFELEKESKILRFVSGYPEAWNGKLQKWIRMKSLHCWGSHKKRMMEYLMRAESKT